MAALQFPLISLVRLPRENNVVLNTNGFSSLVEQANIVIYDSIPHFQQQYLNFK